MAGSDSLLLPNDFLFEDYRDTVLCKNLLHIFQNICMELRAPLPAAKKEGPAHVPSFFGIKINYKHDFSLAARQIRTIIFISTDGKREKKVQT